MRLPTGRMLINIFLLRIVDAHKRLDCFYDPLCIPDQISVCVFGLQPPRKSIEQLRCESRSDTASRKRLICSVALPEQKCGR